MTRRRRTAVPSRALLPVALVLAAGCEVKSGGDASATTTTSQTTQGSGGEVDRSWRAPALSSISGVPAAEVKSALERRLGTARPDGLAEDQLRHVPTL